MTEGLKNQILKCAAFMAEMSYRRGFQHGALSALEALNNNIDRKKIDKVISDFRYSSCNDSRFGPWLTPNKDYKRQPPFKVNKKANEELFGLVSRQINMQSTGSSKLVELLKKVMAK